MQQFTEKKNNKWFKEEKKKADQLTTNALIEVKKNESALYRYRIRTSENENSVTFSHDKSHQVVTVCLNQLQLALTLHFYINYTLIKVINHKHSQIHLLISLTD